MTTPATEPAAAPNTQAAPSTATPKTGDDFDDAPQAGTTPPEPEPPKTFDAAYVEKIRQEAAKHRTEARAAQQELERQRQASMSDAEKQVAEAEKRGREAARSEFGTRFVRSQFDVAAARRNPEFDTAPIVDIVDLTKFLDDDGEVDLTALNKAVERLVPAAVTGPPSQDGGARSTTKPTSMNDIIRAQAKGGRRPTT